MRYFKLDLNLLVALDVLLEERSITRSAERLHLSQSATSNALARLREYFKDDILTQVGRNLVPTERARHLQDEVRDVLHRVQSRVIEDRPENAAVRRRRITIMAAEAISMLVLAPVGRQVAIEAPQLALDIRKADARPSEQIERGAIDLLIIPRQYASQQQPSVDLFSESFCAVVDADHPAAESALTRETFFAGDHVVVEIGSERKVPFDRMFVEQQGGALNAAVTVSSHIQVPWFVVGTQRIGTMPRSLARRFARDMPLKLLDLPLAVPSLDMVMQWHRYAEDDRELAWIRGLITVVASATEV